MKSDEVDELMNGNGGEGSEVQLSMEHASL